MPVGGVGWQRLVVNGCRNGRRSKQTRGVTVMGTNNIRVDYYSMKHAEAKRRASIYRDMGNPEMAAIATDECCHYASMLNKYKYQ